MFYILSDFIPKMIKSFSLKLKEAKKYHLSSFRVYFLQMTKSFSAEMSLKFTEFVNIAVWLAKVE